MTTKFAALGLVLLLAQGVFAQEKIDIPVAEARVIATRALLAGETELAVEIARRLLQQNPDDRTALVVLAAGAPRLGDAAEGRRAGSRAWSVSTTDAQRYEAARLTALAAANEERFTLATFWLLRALTVTPNAEERALTLRDAAGVRRANPWSTNLSFSIVPSSNVNGGSEDDARPSNITFSRSAQALRGVRSTLNFGTRYRFAEAEKSRSTVGLQYQISKVWLEDEGEIDIIRATDDEPDLLRGSDYDTRYAALSLAHQQVVGPGLIGANATIGLFDYGGEPYYDFTRFGLSATLPASARARLSLAATTEEQRYAEIRNVEDVRRNTVRASWSYRLSNEDRISTTIGYTVANSKTPNSVFDEWSVQGSYSFAEPIGPFSLSVGAGYKWADYPDYRIFFLSDVGREDETFFYNLNIGFPNIEYAGFTPGLAITGSNSDSNFDRFQRNTLSAAVTVNSSF